MNFLNKFQHTQDYVDFNLQPLKETLDIINTLHKQLQNKTDAELQNKATLLKKKAIQSTNLDTLLPETYALVKEVCIRKLKLSPFDVQIMAAIALHDGKLIEMQTGEGKTLAAVFTATLNAFKGKGVHIMTFNDYLAKRDATNMGVVYQFLGLSTGYITESMTVNQRQAAYNCDITYATAKEIGFDYLKGFIAHNKNEIVLPPLNFCIVDEADAILIDEARTPLVLAGNLIESNLNHYKITEAVEQLQPNTDYEIDENGQNVFLSEKGTEKIEQLFNIRDLHDVNNFPLQSAVNLALHAKVLLKKDIDYIVKNEEIKLIDEFTGRIVKDRKWRNGLQTAVEAREGLNIQSEGVILNSITLQHLLHKYPKKAGMTATARQAAREFLEFYGMPTVIIPPNKKSNRKDLPDAVFTTKSAKINALLKEIHTIHNTGQPILIGTLNVKESELLAQKIRNSGLPCHVLNAKNDEKEAAIIAEAGAPGAITISTNMAGRGTDIKLGGKDGLQKMEVTAAGGLFVIGTNKHESARIDRQLIGRAGRQGDIGASRFFVSFEDELMVRYNLQETLPKKFKHLKNEAQIRDQKISSFLNKTQKIIEERFFDMRKTLYEYAAFLEQQRLIFQNERQQLLIDDDYLITNYNLNASRSDTDFLKKAKAIILFNYDKHWADHLDYMSRVREGIHLQRFGGLNPLRVYRQKADEHFQTTQMSLQDAIKNHLQLLHKNPELSPEDLGMKRPSATWTYIINDNTFGDQLSIMLLDNSNIGFQVDFISVLFLAIFSLFKKMKRSNYGSGIQKNEF